MRFIFTKISEQYLPGLRINIHESGNLATLNIGPVASNAYFTCGDLVINYNKESGEIISIDGYLPYFDDIKISKALKLPKDPIPGRLFLGDLDVRPYFPIEKLPLELSGNKKIIHAGKNRSKEFIKLSDDIYIGLLSGSIKDIYIRLT